MAVLAAALAGTAPTAVAAPGAASAAWIPDGTQVLGSASGSGAPVLQAGASYRDTLAKGQTKYYAVRLGAVPAAGDTLQGGGAPDSGGVGAGGTTSYLSAFAVPRPGSKVSFLDGISLRLQAAGGTLCASYDARFAGDGATSPVGGLVRRPGTVGAVCRAAGTFLLSVQRVSAPSSAGDVWPLDLRYMAEPGLASAPAEQPVPTYASASPPAVGGIPQRLTGGAGMDGSGVRVQGGVYRDHLEPGQTRYYRVPVDWGQRLFATAEFGDTTVTGIGGLAFNGVQVAVYSPARGYVDGETATYAGHPTSVGTQVTPVAYVNRLSSDSRVNSAAVAGWYYVQVSLHPAVAKFSTGGVDVTLRLRVGGAAQSGPDYRGSAAAAGFGVSGPGPRTVTSGPVQRAAGDGPGGFSMRRSVAYGAFALAAVLFVWPTAWLTLWLARGRRVGGGRRRKR